MHACLQPPQRFSVCLHLAAGRPNQPSSVRFRSDPQHHDTSAPVIRRRALRCGTLTTPPGCPSLSPQNRLLNLFVFGTITLILIPKLSASQHPSRRKGFHSRTTTALRLLFSPSPYPDILASASCFLHHASFSTLLFSKARTRSSTRTRTWYDAVEACTEDGALQCLAATFMLCIVAKPQSIYRLALRYSACSILAAPHPVLQLNVDWRGRGD